MARNERFEQMRNYLGVVGAFSQQSRDASQAGIAAVIAAGDILIEPGSESLPESVVVSSATDSGEPGA